MLEDDLNKALEDASQEARDQIGYIPLKFLEMLKEYGPVETSKRLINGKEAKKGFTRLWENGRLDLSVEAVILEGPWIKLFNNSDVKNAEKRLKQYEYSYKKYQLSAPWSDLELSIAVDAYFKMLTLELAGQEYNKSEFRRNLIKNNLQNRNKKSIELRMQNISSVLQDMGLNWIKGYKPASNVGANVRKRIKEIIHKNHISIEVFLPTTSIDGLDINVSKLLSIGLSEKPTGIVKPEKSNVSTSSYKTCPRVKAWVLQTAGGVCESCECEAPFTKKNGVKFLELHHIKHLANQGPDQIENAVALCPNCHRAFHFSIDSELLLESIYNKIERLVKY